MKHSFTEKLHLKDCLMLSHPSGFFSFQKLQREVVGRTGTDEAPPKPCWEYLKFPLLFSSIQLAVEGWVLRRGEVLLSLPGLTDKWRDMSEHLPIGQHRPLYFGPSHVGLFLLRFMFAVLALSSEPDFIWEGP